MEYIMDMAEAAGLQDPKGIQEGQTTSKRPTKRTEMAVN